MSTGGLGIQRSVIADSSFVILMDLPHTRMELSSGPWLSRRQQPLGFDWCERDELVYRPDLRLERGKSKNVNWRAYAKNGLAAWISTSRQHTDSWD
jgi:hypothetical protein